MLSSIRTSFFGSQQAVMPADSHSLISSVLVPVPHNIYLLIHQRYVSSCKSVTHTSYFLIPNVKQIKKVFALFLTSLESLFHRLSHITEKYQRRLKTFNTNAISMVKLWGCNEACLLTGNFCVLFLRSFFLLPLPFGLCHIVGSSMHVLKFFPSRNCLVSVCPCCYPPLISVTSWNTICCHGNDQRCVAWSVMITGLHCSAVFPVSSQRQLLFCSIFLVVLLTCLTNFVPI